MKLQTRTEKINQQIASILDAVNDGNQSSLHAFIEFKKIADLLSNAMDQIKSDAMDELESFGKGEHTVNGVFVSVANVGGRWKFDHIPEHFELKNKLTNLENKLKTAYKASENGLMSVDSESGEISDLPIFTGSTETIKIRMPKTKK